MEDVPIEIRTREATSGAQKYPDHSANSNLSLTSVVIFGGVKSSPEIYLCKSIVSCY